MRKTLTIIAAPALPAVKKSALFAVTCGKIATFAGETR
jgi:hypothetical protein